MGTLSTAPMTLDPWRLFVVAFIVSSFSHRELRSPTSIEADPARGRPRESAFPPSGRARERAQVACIQQEAWVTPPGEIDTFSCHSQEAIKRFADLEAQLSSLKDEPAELYKTQGQNAQRVPKDWPRAGGFDREAAGGVTHQLELSQRENQLEEREEHMSKLEAQNKELVHRWIKRRQEEAARINEVNELVETTKAAAEAGIDAAFASQSRPSNQEQTNLSVHRSVHSLLDLVFAPSGSIYPD
ncbi:hypothetical protein BDK51DRAFT_38847 [Blyttiomyces helicus]|uniref:Autophagy-related protein 16 domain-containing protein n=1 Tax=Blyttiomyces helicus TaxID=388810 RepID=A0A4P9WBN1_9FUNG|nr:hypothetical protein BDK51DRAFT_38847 [Blyttiomyces helicus]|eukprot:RKO87706.1 hypothetical protein BDK51DRAFT_38847 [Blyttiomyces helicus]